MSITEHKQLIIRYFEEAPDNPEIYDQILSASFQVHPLHHATVITEEDTGPQAFKTFAKWLHSVWSDAHMVVDEAIAEGDRVVARWTFSGKHTGEFFGIAPTGRQVSYSGITVFRIEGGKLAEGWAMFDRLWLWQQLGVIADTAEFLENARRSPGGE